MFSPVLFFPAFLCAPVISCSRILGSTRIFLSVLRSCCFIVFFRCPFLLPYNLLPFSTVLNSFSPILVFMFPFLLCYFPFFSFSWILLRTPVFFFCFSWSFLIVLKCSPVPFLFFPRSMFPCSYFIFPSLLSAPAEEAPTAMAHRQD